MISSNLLSACTVSTSTVPFSIQRFSLVKFEIEIVEHSTTTIILLSSFVKITWKYFVFFSLNLELKFFFYYSNLEDCCPGLFFKLANISSIPSILHDYILEFNFWNFYSPDSELIPTSDTSWYRIYTQQELYLYTLR